MEDTKLADGGTVGDGQQEFGAGQVQRLTLQFTRWSLGLGANEPGIEYQLRVDDLSAGIYCSDEQMVLGQLRIALAGQRPCDGSSFDDAKRAGRLSR